ncbi:MAG TPA: transcriptional regulator [Tepidisphaeraceae bacterium]|jgi:DNA-binding MarR family transcriptional regulator|nr:transcriptional regulator [Tepidisphaeraceae bacterium]
MPAGKTDKANANAKDSSAKAEVRERGRFAYQGLERVIHEKARLSILASLAAHPQGLLFNDLKALCSLTDGNLSRQLQVLQENGFVEVWKGFKNRRPQTLCRLTPEGRKRFVEYINTLEAVVSDAAAAAKEKAANVGSPAAEGFVPA